MGKVACIQSEVPVKRKELPYTLPEDVCGTLREIGARGSDVWVQDGVAAEDVLADEGADVVGSVPR